MSRREWQKEIDQIESIVDTKGVDIDEIEVNETKTDDGDKVVSFRVYETKAESEEDSVGVQITKMPDVQTGDMKFRNDVQNKISALKQYLSNDGEVPDPPESNSDDGSESDTDTTSNRTERTREKSADGPGSKLDGEIEAIHDRLDELEARIEAMEEKSEALDGLQQLMQGGE
jgi:hypothetical protein